MDSNLLAALATALAPFLGFLAQAGIGFLKAKTKNQNVQLLLGWADQAVSAAEAQPGITGPDKKQKAIALIAQRIQANKLSSKFSAEQVSAVVEQAVAKLNALQK